MANDVGVSGRGLLRNTIANGAGSLAAAVITLVLTPLLLSRLGVPNYGVWVLASTLTVSRGLFSLADLGLTEATVRAIAAARVNHDRTAIAELASTACLVYLLVGAAASTIVVSLAPTLVTLFNISPQVQGTARVVFTIVGLQLIADLPSLAYLSVVEGAQRYGLLRLIQVGSRTLWAATSAVLVLRGGGVVAVAAASLVCSVLALLASRIAAARVEPGLSLNLRQASRSRLAEVGRYGSKVFVLRVLSVIYGQMDRLIIGGILSVLALARYEIAYSVHSYALAAVTIAGSALVPAAAAAQAQGDHEALRAMYLRGTKYAVALIVPIAIAGMLYTGPIVTTWVGDDFGPAVPLARLFLLYPAFVSVHAVGLSMLVGLGRIGATIPYLALSVLTNLGLSLFLASRLGVAGVILGSLAGYAVVWMPYTWLFLRTFEVDGSSWLRSTIMPNLPSLFAQLVFGSLTLGLATGVDSLWQVGVITGSSVIVYLLVFAATGVSPSERTTMWTALHRAAL